MPHPAQVAKIIAETASAKSSVCAGSHSWFSETQKYSPHIEEVVSFDCLKNDNPRVGNCPTYRLHRSLSSSRPILSAGRM